MKLYYTGADTNKAEQKDKDKSLGGYISSTGIPNDLLNNLFSDISMYTLDNKLSETRALIFKNESNLPLDNLFIHFDKTEDSLGKFEVAAIGLTPNSAGEVFMEQIDNIRSSPFIGTFVESDGEANKQLLSLSLPSQGYIGLWFKRTISEEDKELLTPQSLYDNFISTSTDTILNGNIDIVLTWD